MYVCIQAIMCAQVIGWRSDSVHMLLFITDASYHSAGDGKVDYLSYVNDSFIHVHACTYVLCTILHTYVCTCVLGHADYICDLL